MQLSNVPEVRPARRLLLIACVLFAAAIVFNVVTALIGFHHHDSDRWLNVVRLVPNLVVPLLIWRGYVLLAALAERANVYKQALQEGLPKLQAAVDRHQHDADADVGADAGPGAGGSGEVRVEDAAVRATRAGGPPASGRPVQE